jgi:hypothetical protein
METTDKPEIAEKRGYSLSSLFVLVTASAALVAGFTPLVRLWGAGGEGSVGTVELLLALAAGLVGGLLIGLVLGLLQFRVGMAVPAGAAAGALIGMAAGLVALLPTALLGTSALAMLIGSGLVVAVSLINRRVNG